MARYGNSVRTFQLKPGVMIGDIGKKMGRDGIDNGYIQVSHPSVTPNRSWIDVLIELDPFDSLRM